MKNINIEIWSDVVCPFCYIGKRRLEESLALFKADPTNAGVDIQIEWKSYQLSPDSVSDSSKNIHQYLSEHKGISLEEAKNMNQYVTEMAAQSGLTYNMDAAKVANTYRAHLFLHFMKTKGLQVEAEEAVFKAYFTDGKFVDAMETLSEIAKQLGVEISAADLDLELKKETYKEGFDLDIYEAHQFRISSVPFFVFNRQYGIPGAQPLEVFMDTLKKVSIPE